MFALVDFYDFPIYPEAVYVFHVADKYLGRFIAPIDKRYCDFLIAPLTGINKDKYEVRLYVPIEPPVVPLAASAIDNGRADRTGVSGLLGW